MTSAPIEATKRPLPRPAGWAVVAAIAAMELLLCRITGGPVRIADLVAALLFASLLAAAAEALRRSGRAGHALGTTLVVSLYGLALLLPIVVGRTSWVLAPGLIVLGSLIFIVGPLLRTGALSFRALIALYGAYALAAWGVMVVVGQIGWPGPAVWIPVAAGFALAVALGRLAPAVALAALVPGLAPAPEPGGGVDGRDPDIVLISVDTLRADSADSMRAYRWVANSGVTLEGQASSPWTLPSMATLLTGVTPQRHHAVRDGSLFGQVSEQVQTLAERLRAAGWDTALTAENPFTGVQFGLHRGFRRVDHESSRAWTLPQAPYAASARPLGGTLAGWLGLADPTLFGVDARIESATRFLEERGDGPLFLWIHVLDPHLPYTHAWSLDSLPFWQRADLAHTNRAAIGQNPGPETLALLRRAYEHEVAIVDEALIHFLEALPPAPAGRIVVFTADHGEAFGEHGGFEHGHSMYQELLSIPLAIRGIEGIEPGGLAGLVDIAPTLLEAVGVPAADLDGRALQHPTPATASLGSVNPLYGALHLRALRTGDRKLIADGNSAWEYDLARDPSELQPSSRPLDEVDALLPPLPRLERGVELDAATEDALRALGYLEGNEG